MLCQRVNLKTLAIDKCERRAGFYVATGIAPAMSVKMAGEGSQYAAVTVDANGDYLDGAQRGGPFFAPPYAIPVSDGWRGFLAWHHSPGHSHREYSSALKQR